MCSSSPSVLPSRDKPGGSACRPVTGSVAPMVALLLVALSLGLSNFAAAVGIGVTGTDARTRLRVGLIFGIFETAMPILGLLLGHGLAAALGHAAHWIGAGLLIATGIFALVQAVHGASRQPGNDQPAPAGQRTGRLLLTGAALSIDNVTVGFALGAYRVNLAVAAIVIGVVSVALSLLGLELGGRIGTRAGVRGELIGGIVLIGVGIAIAAGVI
jgi:manganese efflux pump family protein